MFSLSFCMGKWIRTLLGPSLRRTWGFWMLFMGTSLWTESLDPDLSRVRILFRGTTVFQRRLELDSRGSRDWSFRRQGARWYRRTSRCVGAEEKKLCLGLFLTRLLPLLVVLVVLCCSTGAAAAEFLLPLLVFLTSCGGSYGNFLPLPLSASRSWRDCSPRWK